MPVQFTVTACYHTPSKLEVVCPAHGAFFAEIFKGVDLHSLTMTGLGTDSITLTIDGSPSDVSAVEYAYRRAFPYAEVFGHDGEAVP